MSCREAALVLLASLDTRREIGPGVKAGVEIVPFHGSRCKPGFCVCGGTAQKFAIQDALEALREAVQ